MKLATIFFLSLGIIISLWELALFAISVSRVLNTKAHIRTSDRTTEEAILMEPLTRSTLETQTRQMYYHLTVSVIVFILTVLAWL